MKIAIRTNTSPKIADLSAITQANQKGYAARHGYSWVCEPFDYEHFNDCIRDEIRSWQSLLKQNDILMMVGADVMFTNWRIPIESVASRGPIVMARERTSWWPVNNDVMIYNNLPQSFAFLDRMIDDFEIWQHYPWRMQTHTWNLIQDEPWVRHAICLVEPETMNQHPSKWQLGDWIVHFYGLSVEQKTTQARQIATLVPAGQPVLTAKAVGKGPSVL